MLHEVNEIEMSDLSFVDYSIFRKANHCTDIEHNMLLFE
jgi:hypothetical protein